MTLFGFGKKKEKEINAPVCTCNGNCSVSETVEPENLNNCCQDIQGRICCIKVLGSGCCHALYENTQSAVKAMGISVEVEYITDLKKVMEYGVSGRAAPCGSRARRRTRGRCQPRPPGGPSGG